MPFVLTAAALRLGDQTPPSKRTLAIYRLLAQELNYATEKLLRLMCYSFFDKLDLFSNEHNCGVSLETACVELQVDLTGGMRERMEQYRIQSPGGDVINVLRKEVVQRIVEWPKWSVVDYDYMPSFADLVEHFAELAVSAIPLVMLVHLGIASRADTHSCKFHHVCIGRDVTKSLCDAAHEKTLRDLLVTLGTSTPALLDAHCPKERLAYALVQLVQGGIPCISPITRHNIAQMRSLLTPHGKCITEVQLKRIFAFANVANEPLHPRIVIGTAFSLGTGKNDEKPTYHIVVDMSPPSSGRYKTYKTVTQSTSCENAIVRVPIELAKAAVRCDPWLHHYCVALLGAAQDTNEHVDVTSWAYSKINEIAALR